VRTLLVTLTLTACGARAATPVELPITQPIEAAKPDAPKPQEEAIVAEDDAPPPLPQAWTPPTLPQLAFADALKRARDARDAYGRLVVPKAPETVPPDPQIKTWFMRAESLVDQASRMYAAAFHAADASPDGRIDAIAEAAEIDVAFMMKLDELGLITMPKEWRSDPSVKATFEDVAQGPLRRWRDEARGLAKRCVDVSRADHVTTDAARRCASLRIAAPARTAKQHVGPCGCVEGDPMCSASLGGWCGQPR
jgi:hypothetical protein